MIVIKSECANKINSFDGRFENFEDILMDNPLRVELVNEWDPSHPHPAVLSDSVTHLTAGNDLLWYNSHSF